MVTKPRTYRSCAVCQQLIEDSLDAHMGPCTNGKAHVLYSPNLTRK